jgi:hypothetical protein
MMRNGEPDPPVHFPSSAMKTDFNDSMMFRQKKFRQVSLGKIYILPKMLPPKITSSMDLKATKCASPMHCPGAGFTEFYVG